MSLYLKLQQATSEEDVKDAYIKALGLKEYQKGLVDIQTKEMRFEAKVGGKISTYGMFSQLLWYVDFNLNKGEELPPFLCVIDSRKAAIMKTSDAIPLLEKKTIKWGKSGSHVLPEVVDIVSAYIGTYIVSFNMETHEDEFINTVKNAISSGDIIRTQITPDNLKQVFDKWVDMIGKEIQGVREEDFSLLFFADIMHDGTVSTHANLPAELLHKGDSPVFSLNGKLYELGNREGYRRFRAIYAKPPKEEYRDYLLERRDSLIPTDERSFKGAYYTPLHVVDKAYDKLTETLGKSRQKDYIIRDMCCGVGNLEVKHSNHRNIYMSTLDQADIDVMKATKTCVGATRFQYDYLNDDISDEGTIDYDLTKKLPDGLRRAISEGKKILVLINPPYAEAMNAENTSGSDKTDRKKGVQKTKVADFMMNGYGSATRELFTQFVVRISKEIPNATLAMFSKLKYINATFFEKFREKWNAEYLGGFIVHSKAFDGLKGNFPIGFLLRHTKNDINKKISLIEVSAEILDKDAKPIGEKKFYNLPIETYLNNWINRPKSNKDEVVPLTNAISPPTKKDHKTWSDGAIAYLTARGNDIQHTNGTYILSSRAYGDSGGIYVTKDNLWQVSVLYSVRRLVKPTRINDRDQFLQPTGELSDEFKADCLVWMLFSGSNLTASADGLERNDRTRSIVNHFIPYTEQEVGADERFESDFLVQYMREMTFCPEAQAVLDAGRVLWAAYFAQTDPHTVRDELKLNRPDVGRYQIRNALKRRNESGDGVVVSFTEFEKAYKALGEKLRPMVWELGFLR